MMNRPFARGEIGDHQSRANGKNGNASFHVDLLAIMTGQARRTSGASGDLDISSREYERQIDMPAIHGRCF